MDLVSRIISNLNIHYFTSEQVSMIQLAIAEGIKGLEIKEMETLPALVDPTPRIVKEFIIRKRIKGCTPGTLTNYEGTLRMFFRWWNSSDIENIKDTDCLLFLAWCEDSRGICKRTLESKRAVLYSFFKYAFETGKISHNPMETVDKIKFIPKLIAPLNDEELEKVRKAATEMGVRELALVETLYATGCRVSELVGININDVDFDNREIKVLGKGGKERKVYINAKAKLSLLDYLNTREDQDPALFVSDRKPYHRIKKNAVEKIVDQIEHKAGIRKALTPHVFRHTMATDMYAVEENLVNVQKVLGHADPKTTLIYAEIHKDSVKRNYKRSIR